MYVGDVWTCMWVMCGPVCGRCMDLYVGDVWTCMWEMYGPVCG